MYLNSIALGLANKFYLPMTISSLTHNVLDASQSHSNSLGPARVLCMHVHWQQCSAWCMRIGSYLQYYFAFFCHFIIKILEWNGDYCSVYMSDEFDDNMMIMMITSKEILWLMSPYVLPKSARSRNLTHKHSHSQVVNKWAGRPTSSRDASTVTMIDMSFRQFRDDFEGAFPN